MLNNMYNVVLLVCVLMALQSLVQGEYVDLYDDNDDYEDDKPCQDTTGECPAGFKRIPKVGCYAVTKTKLNRDQSAAECIKLNDKAHLVAITSRREQVAIERILRKLPDSITSDSGLCSRHQIWSGFWTSGKLDKPSSSSNPEFSWSFENQADVFAYTHWFQGEPNFTDGNEDCVNIMSYRPYYYGWNDNTCDDPMCAVCEIDM